MSGKLHRVARAEPTTSGDDIGSRPICTTCGGRACFIHIDGFVFAIKATRASLHGNRIIRARWVSICPICDAYLLMQEFTWGVPFYSVPDQAVISIQDCGESEAPLLEFGNLPFTMSALCGALQMLRQVTAERGNRTNEPFDRSLLGPTGIPDDDSALTEWNRQLELLASKFPEPATLAELDSAMRMMVEQVPNVAE